MLAKNIAYQGSLRRALIFYCHAESNEKQTATHTLSIICKNIVFIFDFAYLCLNDKGRLNCFYKHRVMNDSIAQLGVWISKHKYLFVTIAFLVIIIFLDENNMMKHIQNKREIATLESEKAALQKEFDELSRKLEELDADPVLIEKIARERYGMHKKGEEVFIFDD